MRSSGLFFIAAFFLVFVTSCSEDQPLTNRASGKGGVVASGNELATKAGLRILEDNGNAADAAVATLLALSVKTIGAFCIGGEVPFMYYSAETGKVKVLNGQGGAPLDEEGIKWYYEHGIPGGDIKSAAVPAALDLCVTALKQYGTKTFEEVVTPTLEILDAGGPDWYRDTGSGDTIRTERDWYADLAVTFRKLVDAEKSMTGTRNEKLQAVSDRFYRGDIADDLEKWYIEKGGFLRKRDLAAHVTRIEDPVVADYRGYTIYKCGPWTQGPYLLETMRLLEGYDLKEMGHSSADYIHVVTEAMKLALADRDEYYGDPEFVDVPLTALLSDEYTNIRRTLIKMDKASDQIQPGDPYTMSALREGGGRAIKSQGGTTICVVADKWGNVVAATPSGLSSTAGTGGTTGITHGSRLIIFNTWEGHPNSIAPGKRPRTTLTPTLVLKDGRPVLAISVAGGDMQDIAAIQLISNFVDFGMNLEDTYSARRFSTRHFIGSFGQGRPRINDLRVHESVSENVINELKKRGHIVSTSRGNVGGVAMLEIDQESGIVSAAGGRCGSLDPVAE
jgi:gamma-glutamyltranspeptidase/glutathione hydrolase